MKLSFTLFVGLVFTFSCSERKVLTPGGFYTDSMPKSNPRTDQEIYGNIENWVKYNKIKIKQEICGELVYIENEVYDYRGYYNINPKYIYVSANLVEQQMNTLINNLNSNSSAINALRATTSNNSSTFNKSHFVISIRLRIYEGNSTLKMISYSLSESDMVKLESNEKFYYRAKTDFPVNYFNFTIRGNLGVSIVLRYVDERNVLFSSLPDNLGFFTLCVSTPFEFGK
jgi:hypothetical protein